MKMDSRTVVSRHRHRHRRGRGARAVAEGLEPRQMMARIAGIDVSHYQGTGINWSSVAGAGYTFAWAKATEGLTYNDDTFTTNMANAKGKVLIGAYHFARYDIQTGTAGASAEENHFWNIIKPYYTTANAGKYMAPMLDLENATSSVGPSQAGYTKTTFSQWAKQFLNDLKADLASVGVNLTPVVYTGASFAGSWLDPTISASFPVWMANYNGYSRDTGSPFWNGSGSTVYGSPWQTPGGWQFWQYTSSAHVPGVGNGTTTNVDADVFIGDIYSLKSDYVIGGAPRWNVNERVTTNTSVTAWTTSAATTSAGSEASGARATVLSAVPVYGNSFWRWQVRFDNGVTGWVGEDFLDTVAPSAPTTPSPASNGSTYLTSLPATFTWGAAANASSYDVFLDGTKKATVTTNSWTPTAAVADGTHTWYVVAHNSELSTTGATWTFLLDTAGPTATYGGQQPVPGASSLTFTVIYADPGSGVAVGSLGTGDVVVTGPNGYSQVATFVSVNTPTNGSPRVVTYSVPAPDGTWDSADNGAYTVSQAAGQVSDVLGNVRAAGMIGTFALGMQAVYLSGTTLVIDYPTPGPTSLSYSGGNLVVTQGSDSYSFPAASVTGVVVDMAGGDDTLTVGGAVAAPLTFVGAGAGDAVTLSTFASATVATDLAGAAVRVGSSGVLTFAVPQDLASLVLAGGVAVLAPGGGNTLKVGSLSMAGQLELNDNALVWDYDAAGASPADTLRSYLQNGWDGGAWDGSGVVSSLAAGDANHVTGIGYLEAADLGVTTFGGEDVDATALLVRAAPTGDVNMDGTVDADDYTLTDRGFARGVADPHWVDGDFDYDGTLGASDYLLLDTTSLVQSGTGTPSPELLAAREAQFGPAYAAALESALTVDTDTGTTTTFSSDPITTQPDPTPVAAATPPVAVLTAPTRPVRRNKAAAFKFAATHSAATSFTYRVDWNGDGVVDQVLTGGAAVAVGHKFGKPGTHTVTLWVIDNATGLTSDPVSAVLKVS